MNLAELQRFFAAAVTSGRGPVPGLERVFKGSKDLSAEARLGIYNRGYYYRLLDSLASVFRETKRVLGDTEFQRAGLSYLARCPSQHPAVERVGRLFSEHLQGMESLPEAITDLAALEWARSCALVADNPHALAVASSVDPRVFPRVRLRFVPALICLELSRDALRAHAKGSLGFEEAPGVGADRTGVAVWRAKYAVCHESLQPLEFDALRSALSGNTMAEVCALFDSASEVEDAEHAFRIVAGWFARHWVESLELRDP